MKPADFEYHRPATVDEVTALLDRSAASVAVLAGGQALVRLMNLRQARPAVVVDINRVPDLDAVSTTEDTLRVGAMTRLRRLTQDPTVLARLPVLARAAAFVGHPQIRTRATIGGSLCHGDPAAELPALAVALNARLHLRSSGGVRVVPAAEFYHAPYRMARHPTELLTDIEFPAPPGLTATIEEFSFRANDLPLVAVCVGVLLGADVVTRAWVAAAGVGRRPVRLPAVESELVGRSLGAELDAVVAAADGEIDPPPAPGVTADFRRALLRTVLRRAITNLRTDQENA